MKKHGPASKLEPGQLAEFGAAILRQLPHIPGLGEVAQGWIENPMALRKALRESLVPNEKASTVASELLSPVGTVKVPASGKFYASDHFTTSIKAVNIAWIGDAFQQDFLAKVEGSQSEVELRYDMLKQNSLDKQILSELGDKAETTLASIWELLKKQPNGESGALLTNGYANIFYVCDAKGVLWAVSAIWRSDSWDVSAYSVGSPFGWSVSSRVFSRNS